MLAYTPALNKPYADAVVGYLNAIGVKARTDLAEAAVFIQALTRGTDRPLIAFGVDYFQLRDIDQPGFRFTKDQGAASMFDNDEYTQLFRAQRVELDERKRADLIRQMVLIMRDEFTTLFLLSHDNPTLYTKKIREARAEHRPFVSLLERREGSVIRCR